MTAPKKTPLKRAPRKRTVPDHTQEGTRVIVIATEMVECRKLKPYYKNPRIGDPDVVGKSLHINGMFKPIVVNIGSYTKRKNEILAGSHTWLGARREITWEEMVPDGKGGKVPKTFHKTPWDTILVSWVDVDEDAARKIVLEDNKSSDNSSYDEGILADIFSQANDLIGTSWQPDEVEDILASVKVNVDDAMGAVDEALHAAQQMQQEDKAERSFDAAPLGEEGNPDDYEDEYEDDEDSPAYVGTGIERQKEELQGAYQLKEPDGVTFDGIGEWGIVRLRNDQLATIDDFPSDKLDTWGGSATADWEDEDTWWFYNWSTGKTDYIKDLSKVIVGFYAHDQYFENWWWYSNKYVTKIINSGIKIMVTPDWSMEEEMKPAEWLWQLYRARWVGRYFQECGLKVIPNVSWPEGAEGQKFLKKYILPTLPKKLPLISIQMQTVTKETMDNPKAYIEAHNLVFSTLKPDAAILYASGRGRALLSKMDTGNTKLIILETHLEKVESIRGPRKAKKTI